MGRRILGDLTTTKTAVVTATYTKILSMKSDRQHLMYKRNDADFYVFLQEATPSSTDEGTLIDSTYLGEFWDGDNIPTSAVWVYQSTGGNKDIFVREG